MIKECVLHDPLLGFGDIIIIFLDVIHCLTDKEENRIGQGISLIFFFIIWPDFYCLNHGTVER